MPEKNEISKANEIPEVSIPSDTNQRRKSSSVFFTTPSMKMDEPKSSDTSDTNADDRFMSTDSMKELNEYLSSTMRMSTITIPGVNIDPSERNDFRHRSTISLRDNTSRIIINKSDESVIQRERGSTRRNSGFHSSLSPRSLIGEQPIGQGRYSDNIPVRNMAMDCPISENLCPEEADAYADVLEKVVDQLELIRFMIPVSVDQWNESYKTMDEKYGFELSADEEPNSIKDVIPPVRLSSVAEKLQQDRTYIYNVLKTLAEDLRLRRRYDSLEKEVNNIAKNSEAQHNLEINYEIWTEQLKQLRDLIGTEANNSEIKMKKLLALVHESAAAIEKAIFDCGSKLDYIRKWEESRLEQQKLRLEMKEQALQETLSDCMNEERLDEMVSSDLRAFLRADISKVEAEIQSWQARYNDDIDYHQRQIDDMTEEIKDTKEALEIKYKISDQKQAFIDECEAEKGKQVKEAEYWSAIHAAATSIQALWRGYIVRHELGRYKGLKGKLKRRKRLAAKRNKKRAHRLKKIKNPKAVIESKKKN